MVEEELLKIFYAEDNVELTLKQVKKQLACFHFDDDLIKENIDALRLNGTIFFDENTNKYSLCPSKYIIGVINQNKKGTYGVVINNTKYFIRKENLNSALNNDIVLVEQDKNNQYKVVQVLQRTTTKIVCEVQLDKENHKILVPCKVGHTFKIDIGSQKMKKLIEGQIVVVKIGTEKFEESYVGEFVEILGHKTDPDIDLKSIAMVNGFSPTFNEDTQEQIKNMNLEVTPKECIGRLDLRDKTIFTIDGEHTKDIDDAVSIEKLENGNYILGVHIAHVSNYVKLNSPLFNEAAERGNSLYMLDTVIPMLPRELSNEACSLNEGTDRLTRSVFMTYDKTGKMIDYRIVKSVINSKKKMTKECVNDILENNIIPEGYEPFVKDLKLMNELSNILNQRKTERGYISFASEEVVFDFDENGQPININKVVPKTAEKIIENFMIEANCVVAENIYWQKLPFVYRNHGIPDSDKLYDTVSLLKTLGYRISKLSTIEDPTTIQNILSNFTNKEEFPILSTLVLRAMEKAYYGVDNIGHFGLSLGCYTHYTSPIRRLSDLIVHTLLDMYDEGFDVPPQLVSKIVEYCVIASRQERNADIAEYQAYKYASIKLMSDKVGCDFDVFILDINPSKIRIRLENGIDGVIDLERLEVNYQFKEENRAIYMPDGTQFLIGRKIRATLTETSMENLELYFTTQEIENNKGLVKRTRKKS